MDSNAPEITGASPDPLSGNYVAPMQANGLVFPTLSHAVIAFMTTRGVERSFISRIGSMEDLRAHLDTMTVREDWNEIRLDVLKKVVALKFKQHPKLDAALLAATPEDLTKRFGSIAPALIEERVAAGHRLAAYAAEKLAAPIDDVQAPQQQTMSGIVQRVSAPETRFASGY